MRMRLNQRWSAAIHTITLMVVLHILGQVLGLILSPAGLAYGQAVRKGRTPEKPPTAEHQLIRRVVVFPIKTDLPTENAALVEEAWWQAREELTRSRRLLVASKQFLVRSDVYQPRGELQPADAVILGKLLDSHALITLQLENRRLVMNVYDGGNGFLLWTKSVGLHPSMTIQDQLPSLSQKLIADFLGSIPYQGYTVVDALIGHAVYEEGDVKLARIDVGSATGAQIGDNVQWIAITNPTSAPLFQGGGQLTVYAEGKIVRLEQGIATVEVERATSVNSIREFSLIRIPREAERLAAQSTITEGPRASLTTELVTPEANPMERVTKERRPLVTTLSVILSFAAFLLLAL